MTRPTRPTQTLSLFVANVEYHDGIDAILREHKPDAALLQQANKVGMKPGYHTKGFRFSAEAKDIKTLVRHGVPIEARKALIMTEPWVGPKAGRRHDGRVYTALDLKTPWLVNVHFPTGGPYGPNAKAWAESADRIAQFFAHHDRPVIVGGDWNATHAELAPLVKRIDGRITSLGKVDHVIYRGAKLLRTVDIDQPAYAHGWGIATYEIGD